MTSVQRTVIRDYYKQFNPLLLHTLQALTVNEVDKLGRKLDKMRENEDSGEWLIYIKRLYAPFGPIVLFATITLYIVFITKLVVQGATLWIQICNLLLGVTIFLSATLLITMIILFVKQELGKQGVKGWCIVAMIINSPAIAFAIKRIDLCVVVLIIQILGLVIMTRSKRPLEVIRP